MRKRVVILSANCLQDAAPTPPEQSDLRPDRGVEQRQQLIALVEHRVGTIDLKSDQRAVIFVTAARAKLRFIHTKSTHRLPGKIDASPVHQIAPHVLPEVCQLKCAAGDIGQALPLGVTITADVEDKPPDRIGAAPAVVEQLRKSLVSPNALILLEGADQIEEWLD